MSDPSKAWVVVPPCGGVASHAQLLLLLTTMFLEYVDDFDQLKTNFDFRQTYAESIGAALARAYDTEIVDALDASSPSTTVTASGGLTKAKFLEIAEGLNSNSVDTADRFVVISPAALTDLLADSELLLRLMDQYLTLHLQLVSFQTF